MKAFLIFPALMVALFLPYARQQSSFLYSFHHKQTNVAFEAPPVQEFKQKMIIEHDAPPKLNAALFDALVAKKLKGLVKGYAFVIADKNGMVAKSEAGWAQDPSDGNVAMTTKVPSCIGSVSKMMSTAALLHLIETTAGISLDDPIISKLPKKWQQKYAGTRVACLTYRQLLQHRSGFRKSGDLANLDSMATLPGNCPFTASRKYNNNNISLLRYLIPSIAYPQQTADIEKDLGGLPFDEYSKEATMAYSLQFEKYLQEAVLDKGITPITASCRAYKDFSPTVAKAYDDRNDKEGRLRYTEAQHKAAGNYCAPQGSWYLSAEMLANFGRTFLYSNNYISSALQKMIFDDEHTDERLGWATFLIHEDFGKETGQSKWPWHDGDEAGYFAALIQLPNGCVGAALCNSSINTVGQDNPKSTTSFMANVLLDGYYSSLHENAPQEVAKHGIPENRYQQEFNLLANSGYYPTWVDGYDVSGKTFFNVIFRYNTDDYKVEARHDLTRERYQAEYDNWVKAKGYRLQQIDTYLDNGRLKFAAIFIKKPGAPAAQPAYHALSPEEHQVLFEKYSKDGFVPVNVSVTSVNGKRYYAAFYEKRKEADAVLKSFLSQQEYQDMFEAMKKKNYEQVYINAYHHQGQTRFSVIWYRNAGFSRLEATRRSTSLGYQDKWDEHTGKGLLTQCITGYDEGGKHYFAAEWVK